MPVHEPDDMAAGLARVSLSHVLRITPRGHAHQLPEMPGEMGLVEEPGGGRDLPRRPAVEQEPSGPVDSSGVQVLVRCDAVGGAERPYEVRGMGMDEPGGLVEGEAVDDTLVEEFAQAAGEGGIGPG